MLGNLYVCEARIDFTLLETVTNKLLAHCCTETKECLLTFDFLLITVVDFQIGSADLSDRYVVRTVYFAKCRTETLYDIRR
jgi:hypothetical protein